MNILKITLAMALMAGSSYSFACTSSASGSFKGTCDSSSDNNSLAVSIAQHNFSQNDDQRDGVPAMLSGESSPNSLSGNDWSQGVDRQVAQNGNSQNGHVPVAQSGNGSSQIGQPVYGPLVYAVSGGGQFEADSFGPGSSGQSGYFTSGPGQSEQSAFAASGSNMGTPNWRNPHFWWPWPPCHCGCGCNPASPS